LFYDLSSSIKQLQENGFFTWQSTKVGGYDKGAVVSYNGVNYINTVSGNTKAPNISGWTQIISKEEIIGSTPLTGLNADLLRGLPADFTSNKTINGYQKLPSGVIIQWVYYSVGDNATTYTFPIAFPTACLNVTANSITSDVAGIKSFTKTNWVGDISVGSATKKGYYLAIGY